MQSKTEHIKTGFMVSLLAVLISTAICYILATCNFIKTTFPELQMLLSICMLYGIVSNTCTILVALHIEANSTNETSSA